jgi:hypothetical protein
MFKKFVFVLAVAALIASAGTVPSGAHYTITLTQPAVVQGTVLKAGEYRLTLANSKATFTTDTGKNPVETPVTVETQDKKFDATLVKYTSASGKTVISEIRLGGTKTRLVFN